MDIDHIFIFVNSKREADDLVNFGLSEGSGNIHKGVGTANRRFFFENFYLEILWVENEEEAKSVEDIGIWERFNYKNSHYSRFGICFTNTKNTDYIFNYAIKWKAMFLKDNEHVDILTSKNLPWIFRFPANREKNLQDEPKQHKAGLKRLSKIEMSLNIIEFADELSAIKSNTIVEIKKSNKNSLTLEFDNAKSSKVKIFDNLDLVIKY